MNTVDTQAVEKNLEYYRSLVVKRKVLVIRCIKCGTNNYINPFIIHGEGSELSWHCTYCTEELPRQLMENVD